MFQFDKKAHTCPLAKKEGYYEVEEFLERRLRNGMTYEFKVRFKGYGPDDDMWSPASSFNRTVSFQTTSCFGRKRKHKTDDNDSTFTEPKRRKAPKSPKKARQEHQGSQGKQDEREKETRRTGEEVQSKQKRETLASRRFSTKRSKSVGKGKSFRSSLPSLTQKELLQQTTNACIDQKQMEGVVTSSSDYGEFDFAGSLR